MGGLAGEAPYPRRVLLDQSLGLQLGEMLLDHDAFEEAEEGEGEGAVDDVAVYELV